MGTDLHLSLEVQTCTLTTPHQKANKQKTPKSTEMFQLGSWKQSSGTGACCFLLQHLWMGENRAGVEGFPSSECWGCCCFAIQPDS